MLFGVTRPKDSGWGFRERKGMGRKRKWRGRNRREEVAKSSEDRKEMDVVGELFSFHSFLFF